MENLDMKALFSMTYGMYIVSTKAREKRNGQIANTVMQITSNPCDIATCLNKDNLTTSMIGESGVFSVTILERDVPMTYIGQFGFKSGRDVDKFANVPYLSGSGGAPMPTNWAIAVIEAKVVNAVELPTHVMFVGEVVSSKFLKEAMPLTYADYHLIKKGKSPKSAPTFGFNEIK